MSLLLRRGTLSAGTHPGRAPETVVVRPDPHVAQIVEGLDVEDGLSSLVDAVHADGVPKLLVKIAIVDLRWR